MKLLSMNAACVGDGGLVLNVPVSPAMLLQIRFGAFVAPPERMLEWSGTRRREKRAAPMW
nr:hypothetical protein [Aquabacterium parvum]